MLDFLKIWNHLGMQEGIYLLLCFIYSFTSIFMLYNFFFGKQKYALFIDSTKRPISTK